jgi:hypothetical protein
MASGGSSRGSLWVWWTVGSLRSCDDNQLWGVASPSTTELLFLDGRNAEEDLAAQESSLVFALVRCYELDLPRLQRQLVTFDESHAVDKLTVVADTRRVLLQVSMPSRCRNTHHPLTTTVCASCRCSGRILMS